MISRMEDVVGWIKSSSNNTTSDHKSNPTKRVPPNDSDSEQGNIRRTASLWEKEAYFASIARLKSDIEAVQKATIDIEEISAKSQTALTTHEEQRLSRGLRQVIFAANKKTMIAKSLLTELGKDNDMLRNENVAPNRDSDLRLRDNLLLTTTKKFMEQMKNYQAAQQAYKADLQNKTIRQVKVVKPNATDEEVEQIMSSPGGKDKLYIHFMLGGKVNDDIKTATAKVAEKFSDIKELEKSVAELQQMLLDFSLLIEQQGELTNNIEYNIRNAGDHIDDGEDEIVETFKQQKSIQKKYLWIIMIVITCTIFVLFAFRILPPKNLKY